MNTREIKGKHIAQTSRIVRTDKGWVVPSQTGGGKYLVYTKSIHAMPECTCPDYELRKQPCKHIYAVEIVLKKEIRKGGKVSIEGVGRITYPQNWSAYDKAKTQEKGLFMQLVKDLCSEVENPQYKFGRPTLPMSDMIFASALKVYSTFSLRRFTEDMKVAQEKGYIDKVPYFTSVARYMEKKEMTPILLQLIERSALPLKDVEIKFAVDSSGFSTSRYDRWYSFKYGKEVNSRRWIKAHVMCGTKTNVITAVKLTPSFGGDSPQFKALVEATAKNFRIEEVSADKAYLSKENFHAVANKGGMPFIPFKSNNTGKADGSMLWSKLYYYFMFNREYFMKHYNMRSNVETVFHMIKAKFTSYIRSKTDTAQINEVLLKVLCHNVCVVIQEIFELGITPNFGGEQ